MDLPELKELVALMRYTSNNLGQMARRMNEGGQIYEVDVREVCQNQERLWKRLHGILDRMSRIA